MDISKEIVFKTARSGGKGGQNVNKVETMVQGYFHIDNSELLNLDQKILIKERLQNKITVDGFLQVRNQTERSQLANKELVIKKMTELITKALFIAKKRKPTKLSKAVKQRRLDSKKKAGEVKQDRKKIPIS